MTGKKIEDISAKSEKSLVGHIYSKSGAILNGAKVMCNGFETLTLADGLYLFDDLPSGTYEVTVSLKGFQSESKKISVRDDEVAVLDFHLSAAVGTSKIRGRVYNDSNKPIGDGGTVILILPIANRYAPIDVNGYYEFTGLPSGIYTLYTSILEYIDCNIELGLADGELKTYDFYCKKRRVLEPPLG